jgi:hypothetical protein
MEERGLKKGVDLELGMNLRRTDVLRTRDQILSFEKLVGAVGTKLSKKYKHLAKDIAKTIRDDALQAQKFQRDMNVKGEREAERHTKKMNQIHARAIAENRAVDRSREQNKLQAEKRMNRIHAQAIAANMNMDRKANRQREIETQRHAERQRQAWQKIHRQNSADERRWAAQSQRQGGMGRLGMGAGVGARGTVGGFLTMPGGMGGFYIPGPVGVAATIGSAVIGGAGRAYGAANERFRESDFALRRMYEYTSQEERGRGNTFESMSKDARGLAVRLGYDVVTAADAMQEGLTNAIPAEVAARFAEMADSLSIMEGADLKETVRGLSAIRNAYGLSMKDMEKVPNMLAAAMGEGNLRIQGLSNVIGQTAQVASEAGIPIEELLALTAAFTLKGVSPEVASTSVRSLAVNVIEPSEQAKRVQEELGFVLTPDTVLAMGGLTQALNALARAAEDRGGVRGGMGRVFEAFTGNIRAAKIMPMILQDDGAAVKEALEFQQTAISEDRMGRVAENLRGSPSKRIDRARSRTDIAMQHIASSDLMAGLADAKAALAESIAGTNSALVLGSSNLAVQNYRASVDRDQMWEFTKANFAKIQESKARRQERGLQAREDMRAQDFTTSAEGAQFLIGRGVSGQDARLMAAEIDRRAEADRKSQEWLDSNERMEKAQEIIQVRKSTRAMEELAKEVESTVKKSLPTFQKGLSIASQGMDKWSARIEETRKLRELAGISSAERARGLTVGDFGGVAPAFHTLAREGELTAMAGRSTSAAERAGILGQRADVSGAFSGMNLADIARQGIGTSDLDAYIESQVRGQRLRGAEASQFRRSMRQQARGFEREVSRGYSGFLRAGGGTDEEFAADFALQRGRGTEEEINMALGASMIEAEEKYALNKERYKEYAQQIDDAGTHWNYIVGEMDRVIERNKTLSSDTSFFSEIKESAEAVKHLDSYLEFIQSRIQPVPVDVLRMEKDMNFPEEDQSGRDKLEIDRKYSEETGFMGPNGSGNLVAQSGSTVYNQQRINVTVQLPEGVTDPEAVANAVADRLRTDQERGRVTLEPAA